MKMLSRDVSQRVKNIKEIYAHPWVSSNLKHSDILSMKLVPPYPTEMFLYNFDDSEFSVEEENSLKIMES